MTIDYLNCTACGAEISTKMDVCAYCGDDFKHTGASALLLELRDTLDSKLYELSPSQFAKLIDPTPFAEDALVRFRQAKVQLSFIVYGQKNIKAIEFCALLKQLKELQQGTDGYFAQFVSYIEELLPQTSAKLLAGDYTDILSFLDDKHLDDSKAIEKKLTEQLLIPDLGKEFFDQYNFYNNEANFVDDPSFIKKQQYLNKTFKDSLTKFDLKPY